MTLWVSLKILFGVLQDLREPTKSLRITVYVTKIVWKDEWFQGDYRLVVGQNIYSSYQRAKSASEIENKEERKRHMQKCKCLECKSLSIRTLPKCVKYMS